MIRLVTDDLRPPELTGRRHLLSMADVTRDDVERVLGTARTFASSAASFRRRPTSAATF